MGGPAAVNFGDQTAARGRKETWVKISCCPCAYGVSVSVIDTTLAKINVSAMGHCPQPDH